MKNKLIGDNYLYLTEANQLAYILFYTSKLVAKNLLLRVTLNSFFKLITADKAYKVLAQIFIDYYKITCFKKEYQKLSYKKGDNY